MDELHANFDVLTHEMSFEKNSKDIFTEVLNSPSFLEIILSITNLLKDNNPTSNSNKNKKKYDVIEQYSRYFKDNMPKPKKRFHNHSFNQLSFKTKKCYYSIENETIIIKELIIKMIFRELIKVSTHLSLKYKRKKQKKNFLLSNPIYKNKVEEQKEKEKREKELRDNSLSRRTANISQNQSSSHQRSRSELYPE